MLDLTLAFEQSVSVDYPPAYVSPLQPRLCNFLHTPFCSHNTGMSAIPSFSWHHFYILFFSSLVFLAVPTSIPIYIHKWQARICIWKRTCSFCLSEFGSLSLTSCFPDSSISWRFSNFAILYSWVKSHSGYALHF